MARAQAGPGPERRRRKNYPIVASPQPVNVPRDEIGEPLTPTINPHMGGDRSEGLYLTPPFGDRSEGLNPKPYTPSNKK